MAGMEDGRSILIIRAGVRRHKQAGDTADDTAITNAGSRILAAPRDGLRDREREVVCDQARPSR